MRLPAAPGRSPKKLFEMLARRLPDAEQRESRLEDFVFEALHRHQLALPACQHVVWYRAKKRRIDCCYPDASLVLEAQGFDVHGRRGQFDADALRGNELQLAGFRVLEFTSAFTDRQIAEQVAAALDLPQPPVVGEPLTFAAWLDRWSVSARNRSLTDQTGSVPQTGSVRWGRVNPGCAMHSGC
jgi:very-short-patch-repair endonuclease